MPSTVKLRDLIKCVRACKTQQDERDVIQKECASIRDGFRKGDSERRASHVAKLLYVHMLGYPAHFGQLECLKLVTSNRFNDKRIGYLGAMLLLDELKDVSMLITNSLKNDLNHPMQYVSGLALCTLGTICSNDMARDLASEVEKLLKSANSYIRKKAVLCAVRIIRKVPDLMDNFVPATRSLLGEKNHGVLMTGVTLITEICNSSPENVTHFVRMVPTLNRLLKGLIMTGYSPEHDVNGVTDPFLQCKIIRLLKILCKDDTEASDSLNDILAQVATNTDTSKTAGNAILYETVMCIMGIDAEQGLRVLAINSLGKFLHNADRNIRYVALATMLQIVQNPDCFEAVAKHREPIIDCLSEPDITLRKRALVLIFALINKQNVQNLVRELLQYLELADLEHRAYMVKELFAVALKFAPDRKWHVDTLLTTVKRAPAHVPDNLIPSIVQLLANSPDFHGYIGQTCYNMLRENCHDTALAQICAWCVGEFGDKIFGGSVIEPAFDGNTTELLDLLHKVMSFPQATDTTRQVALTAIMKLSTRIPSEMGRIRTMIGSFADNVQVELQQRSVEYTSIFNAHNGIRDSLLERMPVAATLSIQSTGGAPEAVAPVAAAPAASGGGGSGGGDLLGDLLGSGAAPAAPTAGSGGLLDLLSGPSTAAPVAAPVAGGGDSLLDLLGGPPTAPAAPLGGGGGDLMGLLGGPSMATPAAPLGGGDLLGGLGLGGLGAAPTPAVAPPANGGGLGDLLGGGLTTPAAPPAGAIPPITAWEKNGLTVRFDFSKNPSAPDVIQIMMTATNSTPMPMENYEFQIAIPKSHEMRMQQQSSSVVPPSNSGSVTTPVLIKNPQKLPLRMKVRVVYTTAAGRVEEVGEVVNFPPNAL
mmetsp:Transcript_26730/g.70238  ORF Transcript_26730/g.70238 Transcript_26730/m.70238 type:complete len:874 (+) Transcript_26730:75-2696(+)